MVLESSWGVRVSQTNHTPAQCGDTFVKTHGYPKRLQTPQTKSASLKKTKCNQNLLENETFYCSCSIMSSCVIGYYAMLEGIYYLSRHMMSRRPARFQVLQHTTFVWHFSLPHSYPDVFSLCFEDIVVV